MNRLFSNSIVATFYCIALLFAIYTPSFSQPIYLKTLSPARGNNFTQNMHSVIPLAGNKLMFFCNSTQLGNSKLMVATTDETCTMQSSFHHGIENSDLITYRSVMAADSTIFTCGSLKNYAGAPDYYVYLSKMTTQGVMLWEKNFMVTGMGSTLTAAYDMILLPDTSVIVGGVTGSPKRGLLMRVDKNGNLLWDQNYAGSSNGWITSLAYHPGGDLIVSGVDSLVTANPRLFIARVEIAAGVVQWSKKFNGGLLNYTEADVLSTLDGNIAFTTTEQSYRYITIGKLDYATGNQLWFNRTYMGTTQDSAYAYGLIQVTNGDYIVGGKCSTGVRSALFRYNSSGTALNNKIYNTFNGAPIRNFFMHPDGSVLACSDQNIFKIRQNLTTCMGVSVTPTTTAITNNWLNLTLTPATGMNAAITFASSRAGAIWIMGTGCGGKCNIADNFGAGINASDQEYCRGKRVTFSAADVNVASRVWKVNGTTVSTTTGFVRNFNIPGTYTIQNMGQDAFGCRDTATTFLKITNCGPIVQPPSLRQTTVGPISDKSSTLALVPGGGVIMLNTASQTERGLQFTRLDSAITIVWSKRFYSTQHTYARAIARTPDGGYVGIGVYGPSSFNLTHIALVKVDVNGNYIWHTHLRPVGYSAGMTTVDCLTILPDGSIFAGGSTAAGPSGGSNGYGYVIKLNASGVPQWEKNYLMVNAPFFHSKVTGLNYFNNTLWVGGSISASGSFQSFLGKMDPSNGNFLTLNKVTGVYEITDIKPTLDGQIVIAGNDNLGAMAMKVENENQMAWITHLTGSFSSCIVQVSDSGFIVPSTEMHSSGSTTCTKLDKNGAVKGGIQLTSNHRSNVVKDAYGTLWVAGGSTSIVQKFHAEVEVNVCQNPITDVNSLKTGMGFSAFVPGVVDSFMLEDLQPLNTQTATWMGVSQTCASAGCVTGANFMGSIQQCVGIPATFTNETLLGSSYVWKVNGATVSTSTNLTYNFLIGGTYSVRLVATGPTGCVDSLNQTITVPNMVAPGVASNSPVVTLGTINLTANTTPGASYFWTGPNSFTSTLQNPSITNAMPVMTGMYYLTLSSGFCTSMDSVYVIVSSNVSTAGTILSPLADSVRTVNLNLSGPTSANIVTGINGTYSFLNLQPNGNYTVTPSKNNDVNKTNGVSTLDIVLIRRHILVADTLNTPYKILAADANNSGTVSSLDLIFIRSLILGTDTTFPGNRLWSFVPSSTTFPDPVNPWNPSAPPNSLSYINMGGAQTGQNFIGMKLGDVNNSWSYLTPKTHFTGEIELNMPEMSAQTGELISIPVSVAQFKQIAGLQATINWDASLLEFVEVANAKLDCHFGKQKVQEGLLSLSWNENGGGLLSLEDGSPAFILTLKVKGTFGETAELAITSDITAAEAYNSNLDILEIKSSSGKVNIGEKAANQNSTAFFTVFPNPNTGKFTLTFSDAGNQDITVLIYNALGQEVVNSIFVPSGGSFSKEIDISAFGKGVYTLVAWSGEKQLAGKIRVGE